MFSLHRRWTIGAESGLKVLAQFTLPILGALVTSHQQAHAGYIPVQCSLLYLICSTLLSSGLSHSIYACMINPLKRQSKPFIKPFSFGFPHLLLEVHIPIAYQRRK